MENHLPLFFGVIPHDSPIIFHEVVRKGQMIQLFDNICH